MTKITHQNEPLGLSRGSPTIPGEAIQTVLHRPMEPAPFIDWSSLPIEATWRDANFARRTRASEVHSFETMAKTFVIWRDQIKHPDPERAIRFGFVMVALVLRELILFDRAHLFEDVLSLDDQTLGHPLPRMFPSYLGVESNDV